MCRFPKVLTGASCGRLFGYQRYLPALLAAVPWIITSIQFSMRTLLVVTTLIAVILVRW